ncbi:MAG: hypothetical protein KC657_15285 [Myxococcales bacterium]|nr:hypothetical protein [Myxococcales bacterium]
MIEKSLRTASVAFALLAFVGCAAPSSDEDTESTQASALGAAPTLHFKADGSVDVSGEVRSGARVDVVYDADRMPTCRGDIQGGPGWTVTGYYQLGDGAVRTFTAAGLSPDGSKPTFELPAAFEGTELHMWFHNTSRWGCSAWDSAYGQNFHFKTHAKASAPDWAGDLRWLNTRMSCGGGFGGEYCDRERQPLSSAGFTFETWTRQRAAVTELSFEVYEPGTTDWDDPDTWRKLDVRMYSRLGTTGPFQMRYVGLQRRSGNNARYAVNVRDLDPFKLWNTPRSKDECPKLPMRKAGGYVEVDFEFHFEVNGVELRPAGGGEHKGKFVEYGSPFDICF